MSLISLPAAFEVRTCSLRQDVNQRVAASQFGGSEQARDLLNDTWLMDVSLADSAHADGAWREAFIGSFRGQVNWVALWHFVRPQPRGTMRGTPVLVGAHAQGAASLSITGGTAGSTLLAGDMLGVGGLLLMVQSDVTLDGAGAGSVPITNRLRSAQSGGAAVTWDKPTALFRLVDHSGPVYSPGLASAPSFSFREKV
jgi:hypothetical protein